MKREVLIIAAVLMFLSVVSAEIYLDDTSIYSYNIGDEIEFSFEIVQTLPVTGYAEAILDCGGDDNKVIFKQYVNFGTISSRRFNVSSMADLEGDCEIVVSFNEEAVRTREFVISGVLDTEVFLSGRVFMPGEDVFVNGSIDKLSHDDFNYTVEVTLDNFVKKNIGLSGRDFLFNFSVDSDFPPGDVILKIYFEEKDLFGNVINSYTYGDNVTVLAKPSQIVIDSVEEFKPPHDLELTVDLLDQSGGLITGENMAFKIYDDENNLFYDRTILSGENFSIPFSSDSSIGGWRINVFYANLDSVKPLYIRENKEVFVDFSNGTSFVVVQNVGNIPYQGVIEISLVNESGEFFVPINVDVGVGESIDENLGFEGGFNVSAGNRTFSNVYITGAVISSGGVVNYMWLAIIVIVVVALVLFFLFSKYKFNVSKRGKSEGKNDSIPSNVVVSKNRKIKFTFGRKKKEKEPERKTFEPPKKVSVESDEDGLFNLFSRNKKEREIDISDYPDSSFRKEKDPNAGFINIRTRNRDIPVVRNALNEAQKDEVRRGFVDLTKKKKSSGVPRQKKKVYSLFFRNDSEDLVVLLKKYGLNIYKVGDMRFSLLKSSKSPENLLINLAKMVITQTDNKDVLIHSMDFSESNKLSSFFGPIKDILREGEGIVITQQVYARISNRKDFQYFKDLNGKERIIKLFRYLLEE